LDKVWISLVLMVTACQRSILGAQCSVSGIRHNELFDAIDLRVMTGWH